MDWFWRRVLKCQNFSIATQIFLADLTHKVRWKRHMLSRQSKVRAKRATALAGPVQRGVRRR